MSRPKARQAWVLVHRYVGLLMAAFLILEGVTGSLLAFKGPIGAWLSPSTLSPPHPGMAKLGPGVLAERLEAREPRVRVGYFSIDGSEAVIAVQPRTDPATGKPYVLGFDHIVVDPWTGEELGRIRHGGLSKGPQDIMPFVYDLHQNLAVGPWGTILLGVVAALWTADCFVAAYLTFPASLKDFPARWKTAWLIKWPAGAFRLNFDLHRASGLWLWPVWFVFAWSSVMFTLPDQIYGPVTGALFRYSSDADIFARMSRRPQSSAPRIGWVQAQHAGEQLMSQAAAAHGFHIVRPFGMAYIPGWNVYTYDVVSDAQVQAHGWETSLWLDGDTGALVELDIAATRPPGNTVDLWLRALHFGDLNDNLGYRWFVFAVGGVTTTLSITGVYIWWKKRRARERVQSRRGPTGRPGDGRPLAGQATDPKPARTS